MATSEASNEQVLQELDDAVELDETRFLDSSAAARDEAAGDEATGDEATGDQAARDEATGDEATGDQAAGDEATGDQAAAPPNFGYDSDRTATPARTATPMDTPPNEHHLQARQYVLNEQELQRLRSRMEASAAAAHEQWRLRLVQRLREDPDLLRRLRVVTNYPSIFSRPPSQNIGEHPGTEPQYPEEPIDL